MFTYLKSGSVRATAARTLAIVVATAVMMPIDILLAEMSLIASLITRLWMLGAKAIFAGPYGAARVHALEISSAFTENLKDRPFWRKAVVDAPAWMIFQVFFYAIALWYQEKEPATAILPLTFIAGSALIIGPFVGQMIDVFSKMLGADSRPPFETS